MIKSKTNPAVDFYFSKALKWREEIENLRMIVLECGLKEELKWGVPCYTFQESNIVLIHKFKDYCALLFHKGVLLNDDKNILIQQTKNVQAARQIRFTGLNEIKKLKKTIKSYIYEAVEVEKKGLKVRMKETSDFEMPEEFKKKLDKDSKLKKAFESLTPGRQRGYLLYFSAPKQSKTRLERVEKCIAKILIGKGLQDQ